MNHTPKNTTLNRGLRLLIAILWGLVCLSADAHAKGRDQILIRDAEIENTLKNWSEPVIKAAGLNPEQIRFILVQSPDVNAFVAGGQNIFLYTGLLLKAESASEIVGVITHELGHIRGGHLVRTRGQMESASYESILGTVLGIGAAIVTGQGGAAAAISAGAQSMALNNFLAFTRTQESSADQSALSTLERAGVSPAGLLSFMKKLESDELLPASQQTAWMRTHPLTRERIGALAAGMERSSFAHAPEPPEWAAPFARMKAKLVGFISPEQVAWTYDSKDQSLPARYARAIADYRQNNVDQALKETDALLGQEPGNPYFLELKGQMLVDFGKVKDSLPYYKKAVDILPSSGLIRMAYAHVLIETAGEKDKTQLENSITQLERAAKDEPGSTYIQRLLATAYGRLGQEPEARLHLAEEAMLRQDTAGARKMAKAALEGLKPDSSSWLQAKDILARLDVLDKDGEKEKEKEKEKDERLP